MSKAIRLRLFSLTVILALSQLAFGETLEQIVEQVQERNAAIKDMSCRMKVEMNLEGQAMSMEGDVEMLFPDKMAMSFETKMSQMQEPLRTKVVSDGRVMYQELSGNGQKQVNRIDVEAAGMDANVTGLGNFMPGPASSLAGVSKIMDLKVMPDVTLADGQKAWVIEGKFKPDFHSVMQWPGNQGLEILKGQVSGIRMNVGQRDLFMNRMDLLSQTGESAGSVTFSDIKVNQGLTADRFVYEPPEDAVVTDMTEATRRQIEKATKASREAPEEASVKPVVEGAPAEVLRAGVAAPVFTVKTLEGKKLLLTELRGKPVLAVFWATWHKGSVGQLAEIAAMQKDWQPRGLKVVSFSLDEPATAQDVRKLLLEKDIRLDTAFADEVLLDAYWVAQVPSYVLMDGDGRVAASESKPKDVSLLKLTVDRLLKE